MHERNVLAGGFGAVLREARRERRLSAAALARRCGCSTSLVEQLERGTCRLRVRTVTVLAYALDPDAPDPLAERLRAAAGQSLRPDTARSERAWSRRTVGAFVAGARPLPSEIARSIALHTEAAACRRTALALLDQPDAMHNAAVLARARALLERGRTADAAAGPPVELRFGSHPPRRYGFGF
ncbi:helix-turn-helix domain-containing protein [Frankia sp. R82]|uniref:helix-turn-helix domain-containing protein n=1 Tax=Frankia sp. R82 TaxID=2950553 RepID=UPI00204492CD|nr:helix-turn-helix domain-containing protein [Frankia sp. R82]MCM3886652.1 helix-turn-helix domain-containing protein [Frankia sp. R82]